MRAWISVLLGASALAGVASAEAAVIGADESVATVDEVVVTGRVERLYRTRETTAGKGVSDPLDIPQAVTVINEALYEDQGARDAQDLYRNVAGVSFFSYSGVTFRGFRQAQGETYYDNLRGNPFIGFSVPQLFNIERVEVLKGPAGMLYGPGSPGGLINYVTKTPEDERSLEAKLVYGDQGRRGASVEASGPLTGDGRVLGRVGAFYERMEPFRFNTDSETGIYDAGLAFRPRETVDLILQATRYDQKLNGNRLRGVPVDDAGNFLTSVKWNHNEPTDFLDLKADVFQARANLRPAEGVRLDLAARSFKSNEVQQYHEPRGLVDTDGDGRLDATRRQFRDQVRDTEGLALAANLSVERRLFGLDHTVLAGVDRYAEDARFSSSGAREPAGCVTSPTRPVPCLSLLRPAYGLTSPANYNLPAVRPPASLTQTRLWGVYLQDQIALTPQWLLTAGLRYDEAESGGVTEDEVTFRGGVIYKPRPDVSLYASWSEGFEPQDAGSQDPAVGGPFAPVTGEQVEAGAKTTWMNGRVQGQASIYRIVRRNLLQTTGEDPGGDGQDDLAPLGEVTSDGFEVEVAADVTPAWVVTAVYAWNDARITGTAPGQSLENAVGDRFANAPEHQLGFWTRYEFGDLGLAVALGGQHLSERVSLSRQRVKPYTVFDASVVKTLGERFEALVRVDNLFDETYAASGFTRNAGHFPGRPRSFFVELRARY
jgi:iron complex outermembrane receptor protein